MSNVRTKYTVVSCVHYNAMSKMSQRIFH